MRGHLRRKGGKPGFIQPCQPALADRPPAGPGWLHEIKFDGYRDIARKDGERDGPGPGVCRCVGLSKRLDAHEGRAPSIMFLYVPGRHWTSAAGARTPAATRNFDGLVAPMVMPPMPMVPMTVANSDVPVPVMPVAVMPTGVMPADLLLRQRRPSMMFHALYLPAGLLPL